MLQDALVIENVSRKLFTEDGREREREIESDFATEFYHLQSSPSFIIIISLSIVLRTIKTDRIFFREMISLIDKCTMSLDDR